jgi:hypothetical protein
MAGDEKPITAFRCGGDECPAGGEHQWDGEVGEELEGGGGFWSTCCSKCGLSRMDYDLINGEDE